MNQHIHTTFLLIKKNNRLKNNNCLRQIWKILLSLSLSAQALVQDTGFFQLYVKLF